MNTLPDVLDNESLQHTLENSISALTKAKLKMNGTQLSSFDSYEALRDKLIEYDAAELLSKQLEKTAIEDDTGSSGKTKRNRSNNDASASKRQNLGPCQHCGNLHHSDTCWELEKNAHKRPPNCKSR